MDDLDLVPLPTGPRVWWIYATVLVVPVLFIGAAGFGVADIGPCGRSNPIGLLVSALISAAALFVGYVLLSERERRFRLLTVRSSLIVTIALLFVAVQTFLLW